MYTFSQYRVLVQKIMLLFSRSVVSDSFVTPWTSACQAPLSREFHRQEYWNGLPYPPPGGLPNPGIEAESPVSPALKVDSLPAEPYNLKARSKIKMSPGLLPSECSEGQSVCSMPVLASGDSRKPWCFWLTDHASIPCLCPHTVNPYADTH